MNTQDSKELNIEAALRFINQFGWLRPGILGQLVWPLSNQAERMGQRLANHMHSDNLVIRRALPKRAGFAYVLSAKGVRQLARQAIYANTGKDWGCTANGVWSPPTSWRHDIFVHTVLAWLCTPASGIKVTEIITERQIRAQIDWKDTLLPKIPDGLAVLEDGRSIWVEVENSRKSGMHQRRMMDAAMRVMLQSAFMINYYKPGTVLFAYPIDSRDATTGHRIDHRARLEAACQRAADRPIAPIFLEFEQRGATPINLRLCPLEVIEADGTQRLLSLIERKMADGSLELKLGRRCWDLRRIAQTFPKDRRDEPEHANALIAEVNDGFTATVESENKPSQFSRTGAARKVVLAPTFVSSLPEAKRLVARSLQNWLNERLRDEEERLKIARERAEFDYQRYLAQG